MTANAITRPDAVTAEAKTASLLSAGAIAELGRSKSGGEPRKAPAANSREAEGETGRVDDEPGDPRGHQHLPSGPASCDWFLRARLTFRG